MKLNVQLRVLGRFDRQWNGGHFFEDLPELKQLGVRVTCRFIESPNLVSHGRQHRPRFLQKLNRSFTTPYFMRPHSARTIPQLVRLSTEPVRIVMSPCQRRFGGVDQAVVVFVEGFEFAQFGAQLFYLC